MKKLLIALALMASSSAFAHCPDPVTCEMKAIDSSIASGSLKSDTLEKVKTMRAEGQKLHDEGRDQEAVKVLKDARKMIREASSS